MTSRDDKPRGIDFEKIETALKEAAIRATYGSREMSGKFRQMGSEVYVDKAEAVKESNKAL